MTKGQKIALGIGITTLVLAGVGFLAYRKFGKPRVKVTKIDNANKVVYFTWNGNDSRLSFRDNFEGSLGTDVWEFKVSKSPNGNVNGVNLIKRKSGEVVQTITMTS